MISQILVSASLFHHQFVLLLLLTDLCRLQNLPHRCEVFFLELLSLELVQLFLSPVLKSEKCEANLNEQRITSIVNLYTARAIV